MVYIDPVDVAAYMQAAKEMRDLRDKYYASIENTKAIALRVTCGAMSSNATSAEIANALADVACQISASFEDRS